MDNFKDLIITLTRSPSYLVELLQSECDIILVQGRKEPEESFASAEVSLDSTLNLTGSPLEADLNVLPPAMASCITSSQISDETKAKYIPINIRSARNFINYYNKIHSKESKPEPIYSLCDGTDPKRTVILGSHLLNGVATRTLVCLGDLVDESFVKHNLNSMMDQHIQNVGENNPKVKTKITCMYELYGSQITKECSFKNEENTGSILIHATWNSLDYHIPEHRATVKMMLQSIVGHEKSIMYPFFQELAFLQHCLNVRTASDNQNTLDDSLISYNSLDTVNLTKKISEILNDVCVAKEPSVEPNNIQNAIQSIKDTSLLDKLWNILKCCEKVGDLKICFNQLFEVVCDTSLRLQLFGEDENTAIGKMIRNACTSGWTFHLSSKQSLELLIELGLQKLKQKYFAIIKSYGFLLKEELQKKWNETGSSVAETKRGTFVEISVVKSLSQLRYLLCVHVLLEFIQLVEHNCCFSKEVSLNIAKHAYNKYVMDEALLELFPMRERKQLCDLMVPLTFPDVKLIQSCSPAKWQMKMISAEKYSAVTTVFHYSKNPIFPFTVHQNCDVDISNIDVGEKFYVYELEMYSDKIY